MFRVQWRPVPGYEKRYEVSNDGRVRSLRRRIQWGRGHWFVGGRLVAANLNGRGYLKVKLWRKNKAQTMPVHRVVLEAFVGRRARGTVACHRDGNKKNNALRNLRWDTQKANIADFHRNRARGRRV